MVHLEPSAVFGAGWAPLTISEGWRMRGDAWPEVVTLCWGGRTLVKEEEKGPGKESGCTSSKLTQALLAASQEWRVGGSC